MNDVQNKCTYEYRIVKNMRNFMAGGTRCLFSRWIALCAAGFTKAAFRYSLRVLNVYSYALRML